MGGMLCRQANREVLPVSLLFIPHVGHERHHRRDDHPDSRPQEYHRHRDRDEGRPRDRYEDRSRRDDRRDRFDEQDRHSNRRGYEDRRDRYDDRDRDRYGRRSPPRGYERLHHGREQLPLAPEVGSILRWAPGTCTSLAGRWGAACAGSGLHDGDITSTLREVVLRMPLGLGAPAGLARSSCPWHLRLAPS